MSYNKEEVDALIKAANGQNGSTRYNAITALGELTNLSGEPALEVLKALLKATSDRCSQNGAWIALGNLKDKPAIKTCLYQIGRDPSNDVRSNAIEALTTLYDCQEECSEILEILRKALEDPQSNVCSNAIYALEKLYDVR